MPNAIRILAAIPGLLMFLIGVRWVVDPGGAAEALGMPLLDGLGLSTQVGDLAAFFLGTGVFIGLGVAQQKRHWFHAAALLIGSVAVLRTLAWAVHGADFAAPAIAIEVIMTGVLLFAASKVPANA